MYSDPLILGTVQREQFADRRLKQHHTDIERLWKRGLQFPNEVGVPITGPLIPLVFVTPQFCWKERTGISRSIGKSSSMSYQGAASSTSFSNSVSFSSSTSNSNSDSNWKHVSKSYSKYSSSWSNSLAGSLYSFSRSLSFSKWSMFNQVSFFSSGGDKSFYTDLTVPHYTVSWSASSINSASTSLSHAVKSPIIGYMNYTSWYGSSWTSTSNSTTCEYSNSTSLSDSASVSNSCANSASCSNSVELSFFGMGSSSASTSTSCSTGNSCVGSTNTSSMPSTMSVLVSCSTSVAKPIITTATQNPQIPGEATADHPTKLGKCAVTLHPTPHAYIAPTQGIHQWRLSSNGLFPHSFTDQNNSMGLNTVYDCGASTLTSASVSHAASTANSFSFSRSLSYLSGSWKFKARDWRDWNSSYRSISRRGKSLVLTAVHHSSSFSNSNSHGWSASNSASDSNSASNSKSKHWSSSYYDVASVSRTNTAHTLSHSTSRSTRMTISTSCITLIRKYP